MVVRVNVRGGVPLQPRGVRHSHSPVLRAHVQQFLRGVERERGDRRVVIPRLLRGGGEGPTRRVRVELPLHGRSRCASRNDRRARLS